MPNKEKDPTTKTIMLKRFISMPPVGMQTCYSLMEQAIRHCRANSFPYIRNLNLKRTWAEVERYPCLCDNVIQSFFTRRPFNVLHLTNIANKVTFYSKSLFSAL